MDSAARRQCGSGTGYERVAQDPEGARAMGEAARDRLLNEFTLDTMVARYERLHVDCFTRLRRQGQPPIIG